MPPKKENKPATTSSGRRKQTAKVKTAAERRTASKPRRSNALAKQETAFRSGLKRRNTDREEHIAYYVLLAVILGMFLFLGIGSIVWGR